MTLLENRISDVGYAKRQGKIILEFEAISIFQFDIANTKIMLILNAAPTAKPNL